MNNAAQDYYQLLGVDRHTSTEMIAIAFAAKRSAAIQQNIDPETDAAFQQIVYAYEVLSDPQRRDFYDSLLVETAVPTLQLNVTISNKHIPILDTPQLFYLLIEIRPHALAKKQQLPLNLCLVIDRSTSMRGERLERMRTAVQLVYEKLAPGDVLSVISFSDRAEVVLPARAINEQEEARAKIATIQASGGTEIFQGLAAGVQQMHQVALDNYTNHLILLTDGHTYGDEVECLQLAQTVAQENINFTAFGLGTDWNDQFLDALVAPSKGQSSYIDQPQTILAFLEERISGLGAVYARDVCLHTKWPGFTTLQDAFKLTPFAQPLEANRSDIPLGNIEGHVPLTCLFVLQLLTPPFPTRVKIPLRITAEIPGQANQTLQETIKLQLLTTAAQPKPPPALIKAARLLNLYQLNAKALQEAESGQLALAAQRMRHLTTRYIEAGQAQFAQQASLEANRLEQTEALSAEGRKRLKYGTRMLFNQTVIFEQDD